LKTRKMLIFHKKSFILKKNVTQSKSALEKGLSLEKRTKIC
jgi:hypothetical protein